MPNFSVEHIPELTDVPTGSSATFPSGMHSTPQSNLETQWVIHNAAFDLGFLDHELRRVNPAQKPLRETVDVLDTLVLARKKHPGQRNNLDALCKRYRVDNTGRELHGALLDAEILLDVYLAMTGGQIQLVFGEASSPSNTQKEAGTRRAVQTQRAPLPIIKAKTDELCLHDAFVEQLQKTSGQNLWRVL